MQKRSICNNQVAYVWLVGLRNIWIGPCVFEKVLRVLDYFLHPWWKFLNPLSHVRLLVILAYKCLQDALSGGGEIYLTGSEPWASDTCQATSILNFTSDARPQVSVSGNRHQHQSRRD
jgi:hypothetical protein